MVASSSSPLDDARALFEKENLPFPPLPENVANTWQKLDIDDGSFATRRLNSSLYDLNTYFQEAQTGEIPNYVALGFAGHGINSRAVHAYFVEGPLAAFLQLRWANVYDDPYGTQTRVKGAFALTEKLLKEASSVDGQGGFKSGRRMMVKFSDFSGSGWGWANQADSWQETGDLTLLDALSTLRNLRPNSTEPK
jgi:hypothetical protein